MLTNKTSKYDCICKYSYIILCANKIFKCLKNNKNLGQDTDYILPAE